MADSFPSDMTRLEKPVRPHIHRREDKQYRANGIETLFGKCNTRLQDDSAQVYAASLQLG